MSRKKKVILYTTSTCPYCRRLKSFLKDNDIPFSNNDVGKSREKLEEMKKKSGQMSVPVTDVGGTILVGFNRERIARELGLENGIA